MLLEKPKFIHSHFIRSFGRVKSRRLSDHKKDLFTNLLTSYQINQNDLENLKQHPQIHLEIGFGFGDFIFENAKNNPEILFIGCEPHVNGVINLLSKLEAEALPNIRIFISDARLLLEQIPTNFLDKIYILNPDPWPKAKHHKRRLINADLFKVLKEKIKPNGELIIATDSDTYKEWILLEQFKNNLWDWQANSKYDWKSFPDDWVKTKYQKKAEDEGRENVFLRFLVKN